MENAIVFGATTSAVEQYKRITNDYNIVAFVDNDCKKWGTTCFGKPVYNPEWLLEVQNSSGDVCSIETGGGGTKIVITSLSSRDVIRRQLLSMGISPNKIISQYVDEMINARIHFLRDFSKIAQTWCLEGSVAEAGVFQGEYAKYINEYFPFRRLYLFDTFEGFEKTDVEYENEKNYSDAQRGYLDMTSEQMVMDKMEYKEQVIIKRGYFPESAADVDDKFCFVNLDMDLYKPTLAGLRFFYPRMVSGGIIIVHDYFPTGYQGVNDAVSEFLAGTHIIPFPIGDSVSLAIQKNRGRDYCPKL